MALTTSVESVLEVRASHGNALCELRLVVPGLEDAIEALGGLGPLIAAALPLGIRAVASARGGADAWVWRAEVDRATDRAIERLVNVVDTLRLDVVAITASDGTLGTAMRGVGEEVADTLRAVLAASVDPTEPGSLVRALGSVSSQIDAAVEARLVAAQQEASVRQSSLLDSLATAVRQIREIDDASPLGTRLAALTNRVDDLVTALAARDARSAERATSTPGGRDYESIVTQHVAAIAQCAGDVVQHTGAQTGVAMARRSGARVGDIVIETADGGAKIVVEAKARQGLTRAQAITELRAGIENRNAQAGVLVVPEPGTLTCGLPLALLDHGLWAVVVDRERPHPGALKLGYGIARSYAVDMAARAVRPDLVDLRARVDEVGRLLSVVTELRTHIRTIGNAHEHAVATLARLEHQLTAAVDAVRQVIAGPDAGRV